MPRFTPFQDYDSEMHRNARNNYSKRCDWKELQTSSRKRYIGSHLVYVKHKLREM